MNMESGKDKPKGGQVFAIVEILHPAIRKETSDHLLA
jgi:hypothetical protein